MMEYKPTFVSFVSSSLYRLSPAIIIGIVMYFIVDSAGLIMWVLSGVTGVFCLYLLLQTIFVHLQKLCLDEDRIRSSNLLATVEMRWSDVVSAVLRERENAVSRTDHLLTLESPHHITSFITSTLSKKDEKIVLEMVGRKTHLVVQRDKPTI